MARYAIESGRTITFKDLTDIWIRHSWLVFPRVEAPGWWLLSGWKVTTAGFGIPIRRPDFGRWARRRISTLHCIMQVTTPLAFRFHPEGALLYLHQTGSSGLRFPTDYFRRAISL